MATEEGGPDGVVVVAGATVIKRSAVAVTGTVPESVTPTVKGKVPPVVGVLRVPIEASRVGPRQRLGGHRLAWARCPPWRGARSWDRRCRQWRLAPTWSDRQRGDGSVTVTSTAVEAEWWWRSRRSIGAHLVVPGMA